MKNFMDDDFLLESDLAKKLFAACRDEPIFDYHCHLIPAQIADNKSFDNLTEIWLGGDHYKWRMMRAMGINEEYITGKAEPYEKFLGWARTIENLIGNPLYHWTHLELQRYFGIHEVLTEKSAKAIWEEANRKLKTPELSVKGILDKFNVYAVGTTDDPTDSLEHHRSIKEGSAKIGRINTKVIPSFRPDKALNIDKEGFPEYMATLGQAAGMRINRVSDVSAALENRLKFFVSLGARASDHALEAPPWVIKSEKEIDAILQKALGGAEVNREEAEAYKTYVLTDLAHLYAENHIAMQYHIAAYRNVSGKIMSRLGPDSGNDIVNDRRVSENLAGLLRHIEQSGKIPRTILYSLNQKDFYPLATIMGCFQDYDSPGGGFPGKMQLGSSWWYLDHIDGMVNQMRLLASVGVFSLFIGMLTDSRSFLSYPRHEYFRRILCNLIADWVEAGQYPANEEKLKEMVQNISFGNAKQYFES